LKDASRRCAVVGCARHVVADGEDWVYIEEKYIISYGCRTF